MVEQTQTAPDPMAQPTAVATLPPTGIQQQVSSINQQQQKGKLAQAAVTQIGGQQQTAQAQIPPVPGDDYTATPIGTTSLERLTSSLASQYGLDVGGGSIVDEMGNITLDPKAYAEEQGMGVIDVAQKMSYMSQSLADYQNRQAQQKSIAALQSGLGQVRSRGRGSLAAMQSGFYQQMSQVYSDPNMLSQAQDFSYYVLDEMQSRELAMREREMKKQKTGIIGGILGAVGAVVGAIYGGGAGAAAGASAGMAIGGAFE